MQYTIYTQNNVKYRFWSPFTGIRGNSNSIHLLNKKTGQEIALICDAYKFGIIDHNLKMGIKDRDLQILLEKLTNTENTYEIFIKNGFVE